MKMKFLRFIPVLLIAVLLLSGCIPHFKNPGELQIPSWTVPVKVPLMKYNVALSEYIEKVPGITSEPDTHIYKYQLHMDENDLPLNMPKMALQDGALKFDGFNWTQGAITVDSGMTDLRLAYFLGDPPDEAIAPLTDTHTYSEEVGSGYITLPFDKVRLSNSASNAITFNIKTDEPLDDLIITLTDKAGNAIAPSIHVSDVGPDDEISNPAQYTIIRTMSLAGCTLTKEMDFKVQTTRHSSFAAVDVTVDMADQLEVVEVSGFNPADIGMNLPSIDIPEFTPLSALPGVKEVKLKSGRIRILESTVSDGDAEFPFGIQVNGFFLGGENRLKVDAKGMYIDLAGVTLTPETTISGNVGVQFADPLVYDVWDDETNKIIPYQYTLGFSMENLEADSISGDISGVIPDQDPSTPEWDFPIPNQNLGLQQVTYPVDFTGIDVTDINLKLVLENNTGFQGDFLLTMKAYSDDQGTPLLGSDGKPLVASFDMLVKPRQPFTFDFAAQPDYQKFLNLINAKPNYVSFEIGGRFILGADFTISSSDNIKPTLDVAIPLAVGIQPGGATIPGVYSVNMTLTPDEIDMIEMANEFVADAGLHIIYTNRSEIGVGGVLRFSTPDNKRKTLTATILPGAVKDEAVVRIDQELIDILKNPAGFIVTCDVVIPNDSNSKRIMSLKSTDQIDCTIWADGRIKAHVPGQQ